MGRPAKEFSDESYEGAAYRLRIIPDRGAEEVTVTVPTGVAEAKDDASNINAEGSETFALARAAALTASFEDLPSTHDGESAFEFRIAFSEDIDADADAMRDHALTVAGGAVTGAARVNSRDDLWRFTVEPSGRGEVEIELPAGRDCAEAGAVCTADGRQLSAGVLGLVTGPPAEPLTASFEGLPSSHDGGSFSFRIAFSEEIDADADAMRDHALEVSGGGVSEAGRVNGADDLWRFTVAPSGAGDVEIRLPGGRDCADAGAICTSDGRQLSAGLAGTVEGPPPLTAAFSSLPEEHDGTSAFDFRVAFSEDIGNSYTTLRDAAFTVTGGGVTGAHRVDGRNDLWEITVRPDSREEITVTLPGGRECGATGAVCTGGDHPRPLSNSPSATVAGPPLDPLTASFDGVPAEHTGER